MVWTEWLIMDKGTLIMFIVASVAFYWLTKVIKLDDVKKEERMHRNAYLLGLAVSISSWFSLGLWSLAVVAFYNLGVFVIDTWMKRV